jgi:hypothetical protein
MRIRSALAVFLISVTTLGLVTPLAQADSEPTARELLEKCNNGSDSCVFHPSSRKEFGGRRQQVGRTVYNCSTVNQLETISWSEYTGGSNSLGISITATAKFSEVYSVAVTATYNVSWEWGHTVTRSDGLTTPPWGVGKIFHAPSMQTVTGDYEIHFGKRFHGHYYWYVRNFSATTPMSNDGSVTFSTRGMTKDERRRCPH